MKLICVVAILVFVASPTLVAAADPIPEFFGIYAVVDDKLIELKPIARNCYNPGLDSGIGGADLIRCLNYPSLPHGNVRFIVYSQNAARYMHIPARRIARAESQETLDFSGNRVTERESLKGFWYSTDKGETLRVAPVHSSPQLMIQAVPSRPLTPGVWALDLGRILYPFGVGPNPESSADCVVRVIHITGVKYRNCQPEQANRAEAETGVEREVGGEDRQAEVPGACLSKALVTLVPSGSTVKIMKRPDALADRLTTLPSGATVRTLGAFQGTYCKVEIGQSIGWVSFRDIGPEQENQ